MTEYLPYFIVIFQIKWLSIAFSDTDLMLLSCLSEQKQAAVVCYCILNSSIGDTKRGTCIMSTQWCLKSWVEQFETTACNSLECFLTTSTGCVGSTSVVILNPDCSHDINLYCVTCHLNPICQQIKSWKSFYHITIFIWALHCLHSPTRV